MDQRLQNCNQIAGFFNQSANQVAGIFNQPYLQNKSIKSRDFLEVDTDLHKLRVDQFFFGWTLSEIGVASLLL